MVSSAGRRARARDASAAADLDDDEDADRLTAPDSMFSRGEREGGLPDSRDN